MFFAKGTSNSPINDKFYKGSVTAFCSVLECEFAPGILRFLSIARVHHRILINVIVFKDFSGLTLEWAPESSIFHMFYKGLGSGFSNCAKRCFPMVFLAFWRYLERPPASPISFFLSEHFLSFISHGRAEVHE